MEGLQAVYSESSGEPNQCYSFTGHQNYPKIRLAIMATTNTFEDTQHTSSCHSAQQEDTDEFFDSIQYQANMSKRRLRYPALQQENNAPSRVNKMRNIFEEAASDPASLSASTWRISQQADSLGCSIPSSSNKAIRLSVHKTASDYLPSSSGPSSKAVLPCPQSLNSHSASHLPSSLNSSPLRPARKPLSSGHNTPSRIPRPIRDLNTVKLTAGFTYGEDSDDEDIHSTHGVPLIMPIRRKESDIRQKTSTVSQWLQTVEPPEVDRSFKNTVRSTEEKPQSSRNKVNNKENCRPERSATNNHIPKNLSTIEPFKAGPSTTILPKSHKDLKSNKPIERFPQHARTTTTANNNNIAKRSTPPTGLLLLPPRRIGQTPNNTSMPVRNPDTFRQINSLRQSPKINKTDDARCRSLPPNQTGQDDDEDLLELSPSVNRNRRRQRAGFAKKGTISSSSSPSVKETATKQDSSSSSNNIELADFVLALEAHDREEEVLRGRC